MKKIKAWIFIFILGVIGLSFIPTLHANDTISVHVFKTEFCSNCQAMQVYLETLEESYPSIEIIAYDISDQQNSDLLDQVVEAFETDRYVPTVVIGGLIFIGHNDTVEVDIEQTIERYMEEDYVDIVKKLIQGEEILITDFDTLERTTVHLPLIGEVEIASMSLFLGAVLLGFVDGFNPCAMWVLIFLIGMLINMRNRKRMWMIGVTFLFTSAFVYFLIMVSWLQVAVQITTVRWLRNIIGMVALGFGGYNLYKFFKNRKQDVGCEVTNDTQRNKLMERIKNIVKKQNLLLALVGVIVLAVIVNLIELACSAGLPLLYTQILAYNDLTNGMYFLYIGVYILFFLIDDLIIFTIAMLSMKLTGISNKYANLSTLIGGTLMILIGFLLIFFPNIIMFNF